jgi:hypothetical protein
MPKALSLDLRLRIAGWAGVGCICSVKPEPMAAYYAPRPDSRHSAFGHELPFRFAPMHEPARAGGVPEAA